MHDRAAATLALTLCGASALAQTEDRTPPELRSPDGRIHVTVHLPTAGGTDLPSWSATFAGAPVLSDCRLSFSLAGDGDRLAGAHLRDAKASAHDERIPVRFGRAASARDRFAELRLDLQRQGAPPLVVTFRCYDDAIALRYEVPATPGHDTLRLAAEGTSFGLVGDPHAYVQYLENHRTSHEHDVTTSTWAGLPADRLIDLPATFAWQDGPFLSITEAGLRRYAGMALRRRAGDPALVAELAPRADGLLVVRPLPVLSPWRVVLLADRPGALLESTTTYCLNDPPPTKDLAWIRPGKMTWPWWNGYLVEATPAEPILSLAANRKYIDFCAAHGIAFHAVVADESDTPWYVQSKKGLFPSPDSDATRPRADLDLAAIAAYAQAKGVRLWTWIHQGAVRGRVDAVFAALARLGFAGVMIDFLDHDDQDTVEFAEEVLQSAARHHVLVHFHGMYEPTGWQRTYPHLTSHEGALNLEYLKWTQRCTPEHDLLIAFTRLVAGPIDYHLGGFRAVPAARFQPRNIGPNVLGTRCHQLALYVCFDNPNPMVADYPAAYRDQPGFDFIEAVPTWWDETRVLQAEIGRWLLTARRRNGEWWLGGLGAVAARDVEVLLTFLPAGEFTLRLWQDTEDAEAEPNHLRVQNRTVTADTVLAIRVVAGGGFAARLSPRR